MAYWFRALGILLIGVTSWSAFGVVANKLSDDARTAFANQVLLILGGMEMPILWLILTLICFGIAQVAAQQDKINAEIEAAKQRARAKAQKPAARPVNFAPPAVANRPPRLPSPNDVRDSRYQNVHVRRAPGRDVTLRVPPENPARDWKEIPEPRGRID